MTETPRVLDPLSVPLWGSRLVEASAGTGKTWTLAALVLRLVLGHGTSDSDSGFGRPLPPSQILVMTFTRAATRELSDRIRERLAQAARCLRGEVAPAADDTLLAGLLIDYPEGPAREEAAWRAALAADAMDEAAVHTIDAWCQRMLREHAFDSGNLFDEELQPDENAVTAEAARDYWRQQIVPLPADSLDVVLKLWPTVERLTRDVQSLLMYTEPASPHAPTLSLVCAEMLTTRADALVSIKAGWVERVGALRDWFQRMLASDPCPFNRTKLRMQYLTGWLDALAQWAATPEVDHPELTPAAWNRLTPAGIEAARGGKAALLVPAAIAQHLQACADLSALLEGLPAVDPALRRHAAAQVAARVQTLKAISGTYGYADMLQRLDTALAGPRGAVLRERIVAQYPAALIDEFQDTSPLQYRIFDCLYRTAANSRETALFLIGDPKQSIYGFRGADIHSYLRAREATAGRHLILGTNHRSTVALVAAVNHLFGQSEQRRGKGAFAFRTSGGGADGSGGDNPLPFLPVAAQGRAEVLTVAGEAHPALTLCHDTDLRAGDDLREVYAERAAEHIVGLLNADSAAFVVSGNGGPPTTQALKPADIAVLVRTGKEAAAVRLALRRRRIASVYLSDRDSVFATAEAPDLLLWLRAIADPRNVRRLRAAMATRTLGQSLFEMQQLAVDDRELEARLALMAELNGVWRRQGVLAMLRQSLHRLSLPARWLSDAEGERRLTNVLHLAELLQVASKRLDGEQSLLRWLSEQCAQAAANLDEDDSKLVRLESDADLVQVVTVHKSKGLQYPVVVLPFATGFRPAGVEAGGFVLQRNAEGERRPNFSPDKQAKAAAEEERLQEDLRLLYVALTRAQHAVWLGVAGLKIGSNGTCQFHNSALGHLLTGGHEVEAARIGEVLTFAFEDVPDVMVEEAPDDTPCTLLSKRAPLLPLSEPRRYAGSFDRRWSVGSFSSLVSNLSHDPNGPHDPSSRPDGSLMAGAAAQLELLSGPVDEVEAMAMVPGPSGAAPWHRFPRGALAGNFLHAQLQWLAEEGFGSALQDPTLAGRLRRRCERQGYGGERTTDVQTWLTALLQTVLPPLEASLADVQPARAELEFWMPAADLPAARIDALCRLHLLPGLPRPPLPERSLHGMVMGFADLVFEHQGRWWVLDYKSNALGSTDAHYDAPTLAHAVVAHRYEVQAALYMLALHRLLRQRLGAGYAPAQHLGGAIVLFLRGLNGPQRGCCTLPPSLELLESLDAALAGAKA